jgi:hypothetical protein
MTFSPLRTGRWRTRCLRIISTAWAIESSIKTRCGHGLITVEIWGVDFITASSEEEKVFTGTTQQIYSPHDELSTILGWLAMI